MRVADVADDFGTNHAITFVAYLAHVIRIERLEIAWPAAAGVKFGIRGKQRCVAADAGIDAGFVMIPVFAAESALGGCVTGDLVFHGIQLGTPLRIGFLDFWLHVTAP